MYIQYIIQTFQDKFLYFSIPGYCSLTLTIERRQPVYKHPFPMGFQYQIIFKSSNATCLQTPLWAPVCPIHVLPAYHTTPSSLRRFSVMLFLQNSLISVQENQPFSVSSHHILRTLPSYPQNLSITSLTEI